MVHDRDSEETLMYRYANGKVKKFISDVDLGMIYGEENINDIVYGDLYLINENGSSFVCTTNMWETTTRILFPEYTSDFCLIGDKIYFSKSGSRGMRYVLNADDLA